MPRAEDDAEYGPADWIVVPNWDKFQHYGDRNPVWIKLYQSLLSNPDFLDLSMPARGLLVTIWLAYARTSGQLRVKVLRNFCRSSGSFMHKSQLDSLLSKGLVDIRASKPLAHKKEVDVEVETPISPVEKNVTSAKRKEMHEALLAAAIDACADHTGKDSELVQDMLDKLERRYKTRLTHTERDRLWEIAVGWKRAK